MTSPGDYQEALLAARLAPDVSFTLDPDRIRV